MNTEPMATLRLDLKERLLAFELEALIDAVNDTYTALRWFELAEIHRGPGPYPDSQFAPDEFLTVTRVEIGTPNFLEFQGLHEVLQHTLVYLAAVGGLAKFGMGLADKALDLRKKWLENKWGFDPRRLSAELRKLEGEARRVQLENQRIQRELAGRKMPERITDRARRLRREGKASEAVVTYKEKRHGEVMQKLSGWNINEVVEAWTLTPSDDTSLDE